MKQLLSRFAEYNIWANRKIGDRVLSLPEGMINQPAPSSFPTVKATLLHIWTAESIWWQRLKLVERIVVPDESGELNAEQVVNGLLAQSRQWLEWVESASPAALEHVFHYQNTKRQQFKQPVCDVLLHLFNHGTYHRGQIVTQLRQIGVTEIPQTDFIAWSRKSA
ncbi:MAG TPA: DinB family protein [Parasegetibacter sp.]|jgi:uncharacterized damage-inducible protein DinB